MLLVRLLFGQQVHLNVAGPVEFLALLLQGRAAPGHRLLQHFIFLAQLALDFGGGETKNSGAQAQHHVEPPSLEAPYRKCGETSRTSR